MSDQSQGPGWWLASDGKWYPPDQAPALPPRDTWATPPTGPPPSSGMSTGAIVAIVAVVGFLGLLLLSVIALQFLGTEAERSFSSTGTAIDAPTSDGGDTPEGAAELPAGYALIEGDGVSIAAPDTWQEIAPEDFAMSEEDLQEAFPDAPEGYVDQASAFFEQGAVLVAFQTGALAPDNVSIGEFPGTAPFASYEQSARTEVEALGGRVLDSSTFQLPAGEAARVEYSAQVTGVDGAESPFEGVQFYVPIDGRTYVITVTADSDVGALADTMARTFRVD